MKNTRIAIFKGKKIRKTIHVNEWYFSVVDIIEALTDSDKPRDYWYRMKQREKESSGVELSTLCRQLKLESSDGKMYLTEVVNTENAFRIIQSIPSPKAEPFKRWLARVGYERVQEIEDPELASLFLSFPRKRGSRDYSYRFPIRSGMTNGLGMTMGYAKD